MCLLVPGLLRTTISSIVLGPSINDGHPLNHKRLAIHDASRKWLACVDDSVPAFAAMHSSASLLPSSSPANLEFTSLSYNH
jgi:hypothetical protein